ncbi:ABC transporter ATP-binding protein [Phytoactinopolyspora alkaliphila]|uniref:ABC transporter ATP-binding protein n=1 Tax=Phytoactinopolyspora alkaliphila TaxID=1783498 RepID=A0A6N9YSP9_9ACTN|nr:ATP-binding cassette domain-containing protein [Phytoactinopolyspora alkaliphila]NED97985.1 ABC transporter ATP-binding protein [Phytoactinopolyspora alkaliphila]
MNDDVILEARNLVKEFRTGTGVGPRGAARTFRAVDDVSLELRPGKVTALVGQSGSGKSTVARLMAQLYPLTSGEIRLDGQPTAATRGRAFTRYCGSVQMILQDPFSSLNPLHRVSHVLGRALRIHGNAGADVTEASLRLLERVNLTPPERYLDRFPHELSGGERQRVSFARALAATPRVLLADEPVSMLDVTIRKEMLDLLDRLRRESQLAVLYITHDLGSAEAYSDETLVMYRGKVVERGSSRALISDPQHEYTQRLLAAAPDPRRRLP